MDKKIIAIIILSIALLIVSWIAFAPTPIVDDEIVQQRLNALERANDSLSNEVKYAQGKEMAFTHKIDSLQNLKPKIQIQYVQKNNAIDAASVRVIIADFDSIFSSAGIRH